MRREKDIYQEDPLCSFIYSSRLNLPRRKRLFTGGNRNDLLDMGRTDDDDGGERKRVVVEEEDNEVKYSVNWSSFVLWLIFERRRRRSRKKKGKKAL